MVYTYLGCDLATGRVVDELPLTGVSFSDKLGAVGTLTGKLSLTGADRVRAQEYVGATEPGRRAVYVDRDGALVWAGIVWARTWDARDTSLSLSCADWGSYLAHRYVRADLFYRQTEQVEIMRALVGTFMGAGAGVPVRIPPATPTGVRRDRDYLGHERKQVLQLLQQLSQVENGADWSFDPQYDTAGVPGVSFTVGYPLGRPATQTALVLDVAGYAWPEDATTTATLTDALGAGAERAKIVATAEDTTGLRALGFPVLEHVATFDVADPAVLAGHAHEEQHARSGLSVEAEVVADSTELDLLSFRTGDHARVLMDDVRWPAETERSVRILSRTITPTASGERIALGLAEVLT